METGSIANTFGTIYNLHPVKRASNYLFQSIAKKAGAARVSDMEIGQARDWFRNQALDVIRSNPKRMIETAGSFESLQSLSENSIGKMYLFNYDAKHKETLPYFDRFPLIFPIEYYTNGSMLGINVHYLPPVIRAQLMNALYETINNDKMNKTTKLKISYQILKSSTKMKAFGPCVKKYLFSHVKSNFSYIKPEYWDFALMLPLERFNKSTKEQVWRDSMEKLQ